MLPEHCQVRRGGSLDILHGKYGVDLLGQPFGESPATTATGEGPAQVDEDHVVVGTSPIEKGRYGLFGRLGAVHGSRLPAVGQKRQALGVGLGDGVLEWY